jgi:uncharacterized protein (TIGR00297 family)
VPDLDAPAGLRRLLFAVLVAGILAVAARRGRALTTGGALAAVGVGTATIVAGWGWVALLMVFFTTSTALSRIGRAGKQIRTEGVVSKGDERDALQVLANGGVFAIAALGSALVGPALPSTTVWYSLGAGAISAATADTWATEVGTMSDSVPRSVWSWRPVAAGTSGGVTPWGSAASVAGAVLIALVAGGIGWPRAVAWGALTGGLAGSVVDSFAGATIQSRRWCPACKASTERHVHVCGETTTRAGGLPWLDNDAVNALSTAAGAAVAWGVARSLA